MQFHKNLKESKIIFKFFMDKLNSISLVQKILSYVLEDSKNFAKVFLYFLNNKYSKFGDGTKKKGLKKLEQFNYALDCAIILMPISLGLLKYDILKYIIIYNKYYNNNCGCFEICKDENHHKLKNAKFLYNSYNKLFGLRKIFYAFYVYNISNIELDDYKYLL